MPIRLRPLLAAWRMTALLAAAPLAAHAQQPAAAAPPLAAPTPALSAPCEVSRPSALAADANPAYKPLGLTGLDPGLMDRAASPTGDLYQYSNGAWLAHNAIPADRSSWSIFSEAERRNLVVLHSILTDAAASHAAPTTNLYKVGAFYRSGMDAAAIDRQGVAPLRGELARIDAVRDTPGLQAELARLHREGVGAAFAFFVGADYRDSASQTPDLYQGGLGLPDRDYYFKTDADTRRVRAAYWTHVQRMFALLGDAPARAASETAAVRRVETRLAAASSTEVQQRDPVANNHDLTLAQLDALTPGLRWERYLRPLGLARPAALVYNVNQPRFIHAVGAMMTDATLVPMADWRSELRWQLIDADAPYLAAPIEAESFRFHGTVLQGSTRQRPRWERVERVIDEEIGEGLGQLYVQRTFSPEAKAKARAVVVSVRAALRQRLAALPWISAATRRQALVKCDAILIKVGYPDHWRDYSRLRVTDQPYVDNVIAGNEFEFQRDLDKIGRPTDRGEWDMTAPTINAYYDPSTNSINIPAGQLQPPFFDASYDDAVNYGELGATAGHELTHGFDDQGRLYDARGNLHNWWTPQDAAAFRKRADAIVRQYDAYEPLPGVHINGALTQGENIADIGGLKLAYVALETLLSQKGRPALIDGLTPEQRYFVSYGQGWRTLERPRLEREEINTDPHSPPLYRTNGPAEDMPEFYQAFGMAVPASAETTGVW